MYVPSHFRVEDPVVVSSWLRATAFGHLVSTTGGTGDDGRVSIDATPLPFLVDDAGTELRAHVARANPQWRSLDGLRVLVIVPVTDAYISPSWYPSKATEPRVVPTWNYEVVHVHGTAHVHHDAEFLDSVVRDLTALHEKRRRALGDNMPAWSVDDAPADYVAKMLKAIVGIRVAVERVEAKRKLSQNRSIADRRGTAEALSTSASVRAIEVGLAMTDLQNSITPDGE